MSKKDKSKFRKHIKAQILQGMAQAKIQEKEQAASVFKPEPKASNISAQPAISTPQVSAQAESATLSSLQNLAQIKHDLKKTGIVVAILAIIIAILYILDLKYNILISFGNIIFRVLHINQ